MADIRVGEIRTLLQARCPALLHELVPGLRREGNLYSAPNPTRGNDTHGSFKLWKQGAWREYDESEDIGKGDIIGLIAYVNGLPPKSREGRKFAIQWAKKYLGLAEGNPAALQKARKEASREAQERQCQADAEEAARARRIHVRVVDIWTHARDCIFHSEPLVANYLRSRGIDLAAVPNMRAVLREHQALDHWAMPHKAVWTGPAMVARVSAADGTITAIHATFLRDDGTGKAEGMPNPKLMLGPVKGSVVALTNGPTGMPLGVAAEQGKSGPVLLTEGIETGLACAIAIPEARVWACLSLSNVGNAPVDLAGISEVFVALENDLKPQALRQRESVLEKLERMGKRVICMQPHFGSDFADVIKEETYEFG